jgi:hypothetical protein
MTSYVLSQLPDHVLLRDLAALVSQDRTTTAALLAHLAEVDARKLYLPAAHPSMFSYTVRELRLSEDAAFRRIRAARTARQFPAIFPALADGRLNLNAVLMLTPFLTPDTSEELLVAAAGKTKAEIELLLAQRFPQPDLATLVQAIPPKPSQGLPSAPSPDEARPCQLAPAPVGMTKSEHNPAQAASAAPRARVAPLSPERFALQMTISQETHEKLRYAQALLGHAVPTGDIPQVLDRALDALIHELEKRKFAAAACSRPTTRRGKPNERRVPAAVRRVVWQRDGGRCTFVSDKGHRCESRTRLEFDHATPVARGGLATGENLRLRCRGHNQLAAEQVFGPGFMKHKREEPRGRRVQAREASPSRGSARAPEAVQAREREAEATGSIRTDHLSARP